MTPQDFTAACLAKITPGMTVLDIGAGNGRFAQMFADRGAQVVAVDPEAPTGTPPGITFVKQKIEDFIARPGDDKYDFIFLRNIIQFLEKSWTLTALFPWLEEHTTANGLIAIETFYANPEPPFPRPLRSAYELKELTAHFSRWLEIYSAQYEHLGPDMSGHERRFFTTDLIIQKNNP